MRSKAAALGVAVALALGGVLAWGDAVGSASATTITLSANLTEKRGMDVIIGNFERAHPSITVTATYAPQPQRAPVLATEFQAGTAPDVVGLLGENATPPSLDQYAAGGDLLNLSSAAWAAKLPKFIKPAVTFKGKVYASPALTYITTITYNRTLFARLRLKVPQTFSQFLALCGAIRHRAPNAIPLAWPGTQLQVNTDVVVDFALSQVYAKDPRWNQQRNRGKVRFQTTPGWRTAVGSIVRMRAAKCFGPSTASDTFPQTDAQMANERAVMALQSDAALTSVRALNSKDQYDMFPLPGLTKATTYVALDPGENFAVNSRSGNIAAAREFVNFVAQPSQTRLLAGTVGLVSIENDFLAGRARNQKAAARWLGKDHARFAPDAGRLVVNPAFGWPTPTIASALGQEVQGLFTGQTTVNNVLKAMDQAW